MDDDTRFPDAPPAPRAAASLAAIVLLLLVFFVGLAVGQSGVLDPPTTPRAAVGSAPSPGTEEPGASPGAPSPGTATPAPSGAPGGASIDIELLEEALETIRQNFVGRDELTEEQLTYGVLRGLVDALGDTGHSIFLTPEAVRAEEEALGGQIVGIGVLVGVRDDRVVVVSVISGGPAERAGIRSGDAIVAVDGENVEGLAPEEVAANVRGDPGTTVVVTVERPATGERLEFSIVREQLRFPAASWTMVPGTDIALLRLIQFSTESAAELRAARDEAIAAGAGSLILDLRGNPGGWVHEAVDVASLFLDQRTVYIRELADGERIPVVTNDAVDATGLPMVVLIDEGTASSAEIVSGALLSADRAELVGETTFGTGTVLVSFGLSDGSAIRLAVERWLTPDEELIFGRGITPTIELGLAADEVPLEPSDVGRLAPEAVPEMPDRQLLRAIELLGE